MQLELTLHSHEVFWGEKITVLYKATEEQYQKGYDELSTAYPHVTFLKEDNFKQQVVDYVKRNKYSVFFCDDDVMIRPMSDTVEEIATLDSMPDDLLAVSMRLDPKYDWHFERDEAVPIPEMIENTWEWRKAQQDWRFPMSVLGHIFRSEDLLPLVETLMYRNPNQFELTLAENPLPQPLLLCFDEARNINIPANLVQTLFPNKAGTVSVEGLNKRFLAGERIDLDDIIAKTKKARSCFILVPYKFVKVGK
jgi:hypothetical protein